MSPQQRREFLSLIARADQLVADADRLMRDDLPADAWVRAEELREMLVEMTSRIEGRLDNDGN